MAATRRTALVVLAVVLASCGDDDSDDTSSESVCSAIEASNDATRGDAPDLDAAGRHLDEAVELALQGDDEELRAAARSVRAAGGDTADFAIALTDFYRACQDIGG